jgi:hypothetical protein
MAGQSVPKPLVIQSPDSAAIVSKRLCCRRDVLLSTSKSPNFKMSASLTNLT